MGAFAKNTDIKPEHGKPKRGILDEVLDFGHQTEIVQDPAQRIQQILSKLKEISRRIDHLSQS